ncbi:MAG: glucose-1-phosphate adenylyltransferase [Deltaproteobacteria bacterium]|uniref:Glucose-1-phosphate adenylyltransferase n=1 Tax=Candidatus Zymogenus saltonus TaxID=2844893 RepID=A0A9D8PPJ2_9DELT|nr:glucose-1-phosphate adenylyltransferase [Candidatus Zymogenus saltonus]
MVLAGGKGERLYPLTRDRAKPGVPFGANYRIIDFTLSNCANSGLRRIVILTQYKSFSLDRHIQHGWNFFSSQMGEYVDIIPAQQRVSEEWYRGTADAVYQNIYTLEQERPDMTLILSGDHVYRMDYRNLIDFHNAKNADLTVGAIPMPKELSRQFGVMVVDKNYRIIGFQEKPETPETMPSDPNLILASMGIYVFNTEKMVKRIVEDAKRSGSSHDFGKNVIPAMIDRDKVYAFPFVDEVTGRPAYWRDVGTIEAYWEAHMDLISRDPEFSLLNRKWPIYTYEPPTPPAKIISAGTDGEGIQNSIVSGGDLIIGSRVINSVIGRNVSIYEGSEIEESIIMDRVKIGSGARLKKVIIDKNVTIPDGMEIGFSRAEDEKAFDVTKGGIVVIAKMTKFD